MHGILLAERGLEFVLQRGYLQEPTWKPLQLVQVQMSHRSPEKVLAVLEHGHLTLLQILME